MASASIIIGSFLPRVKLDHKVTKEERGPSASPEIRVRLAPLDLKGTEVMRVLQVLR